MSDILANDPATAIRTATQAIEPALIAICRDIHAHPELGFHEVRTAGVVSAELTRLGIAHQTGIGKTGVVGLIQGGRPGKPWPSGPTWTPCRSRKPAGWRLPAPFPA
jgi:hypothetical protein